MFHRKVSGETRFGGVPSTDFHDRKGTMNQDTTLSTRYDPSLVETKWYEAWENAGLFQPRNDGSPVFSITIPPPNITGSLHMGHALCYPIQDLIGRYKRLRGFDVMILPGQDHAGIATQSVVEKQLRKEGTSGRELGREAFVERVWQWRKESGDTILRQLRRLGCGFDWSRERFTLDERYAEAVLKVFIEWFDAGLIYRGKRVVNWDPVLKTSVSDIETERRVVRGKLYYVRYPFADREGHVVIATTRPETILADVAVAVNPSDDRYSGLAGARLRLPLLERIIPVIEDPYPDPAFGTGAVKITPAHDANDYLVGERHGLDKPVVLDESGRVNELGGPYAGLDRNEARKRVVADLEASGLLEKVEDYDIALTVSERSGEPVEPLLSEQWFVSQSKLADLAIEATRQGKVRFTPGRYERVYLEWLENIRDWCVSRQLWWGHRIPVYYDEDGNAHAALSWDEAERKSNKKIVRQDDDVLDTWFSSGLWPFATLGWPDATDDLDRFYPTSVLVTDRNILYLWVARMVMMGLSFRKEVPFREVFIYATVLTEDGRRMSKSLGTGIDPMGVIEAVGADALRLTLLGQTGENQDIRYSERRTQEARNFANKIWNATRFVLLNVSGWVERPQKLEDVDLWLLSRLKRAEETVRLAYDTYDLQSAASALYTFFWSELCDWYIEISKGRLADPEQGDAPRWVLLTALDAFVKMLHPIMPHLTEELYQHLPLPNRAEFVITSTWPELPETFLQPEVESRIERIIAITRDLRALRANVGVGPMKPVPAVYFEGDLADLGEILLSQAWVEQLVPGTPPQDTRFVSTTSEGVDLHLPVEGLVDAQKELERLQKEREKLLVERTRVNSQLSNPSFVERAKPEIVQSIRQKADEVEELLEKIEQRIALFSE